jgi:hypothetical protein
MQVRSLEGFFSLGALAREIGVPLQQARYIIERRGIQPIGRVANTKIYGPSEVAAVREGIALALSRPGPGRTLSQTTKV